MPSWTSHSSTPSGLTLRSRILWEEWTLPGSEHTSELCRSLLSRESWEVSAFMGVGSLQDRLKLRSRRSANVWAFTRRLPTMRRCLRKFLGKEAPGGAGEALDPVPARRHRCP